MTLINEGEFNLQQGTLRLHSPATGSGALTSVQNTTLWLQSDFAGGDLTISGTLLIEPEKTISLAGGYTQLATGSLKATILSPYQPVMQATGEIAVDGSIEMFLAPPPLVQTSVPIMTSELGPVSGAFATAKLHPHGELVYETGQIRWIAYKPGDLNGNAIVNVDDLLIVINSWGMCPPPQFNCIADFNIDGVVSIDDLLFVINNWG
jgi:hypothetical protein